MTIADELISYCLHNSSLVVNFARDLQNDFYPYFGKLYPLLIQLLDIGDTDIIEVRDLVAIIFTITFKFCNWKMKLSKILNILATNRMYSRPWRTYSSIFGDI